MPEWSSWCWSSNSFFLLFLFYHWFHKWPSQLPTTSVTQAIKLILIRYFCYLVSRLWRREIRIAQRLLSISISKVYEKKKNNKEGSGTNRSTFKAFDSVSRISKESSKSYFPLWSRSGLQLSLMALKQAWALRKCWVSTRVVFISWRNNTCVVYTRLTVWTFLGEGGRNPCAG